jgi:hypothetical protein
MSASIPGAWPDPLTEAVAGVLAVPLRELYALLWRAGVVVVDGRCPADVVAAGSSRGAKAAPAVATAATPSA